MSAQSPFFVPDPDLLVYDFALPYSLYVNSSVVEKHEHYVRIFPRGDALTPPEFEALKAKYQQVYISEDERSEYLKGACQYKGKSEKEKVTLLKSSAMGHLTTLFESKKDLSVAVVNQTLLGCRQTVEGFVYLVKDYDLGGLHELIGELSFHDYYTYDHSINVSMYCILIHKILHPEAPEIQAVNAGMGGFLHDIGKIKISNRIINKVGKLSEEEFGEIKRHPGYGKDFLMQDGVHAPKGTELELIRDVVYQHHENFDGSGYPDRTKGEAIHLMARIASVADFFDAITTRRAYSEALSVEEAVGVMRKTVGKKLDPMVFNAFANHMANRYEEKISPFELATDFDPCQPHVRLKKKED
jgi:HD-GYP domain-containing protein (c-di-GMP phosphodiesterase class II)